MEFFNLIKASQKSKKPNGIFWFTAKTEARAKLQAQVILEDAEIEVGRGHDYQLPVLTDFPVVNDLPEEGVVDFTWCDRYELQEDGRTWLPKAKPAESVNIQDERAQMEETAGGNKSGLQERAASHQSYTFEQRVLGTWLFGLFDELSAEQKGEITRLSMDMDATYPQNVLLACRSHDLRQLQHVFPETLADLLAETKSVWPLDGKAPQLAHLVAFFGEWINAHNNACDTGGHGNHQVRSDVTAKWQKKSGTVVTQRTDVGTNAGGGIVTDRSQDYTHTLDTLDYEIAAATLPIDFDIYNIPVSIHRRAREIIEKKESPFREWSAALRKTAGILDYSRAAIFALIRGAAENVHHFPVSLQTYISANLKEHQHDKPDAATVEAAQFSRETLNKQLAAGRGEYVEGISDPADPKWDKTSRKTFCTHEENLQRVREEGARRRAEEAAAQPKVESLGAGVFSIEGLTANPPVTPDNGPVMGDATYQEMAEGLREELEITEDVQMETAVSNEIPAGTQVSAGEGADADHPQADAVSATEVFAAGCPALAAAAEQQSEQQNIPENISATEEDPVIEYPAFFEPGRYEGLPNNVYHAANGISSTMVKDARVSLMFYHGRHVTKTIRRESSEALTFGSLTHALTLEPEKLHEEFAVFPGVPEEAFTTTDSMKAFIREFNADKPKAEQLKLTGKKEELQAAIRAVNPGAIFADEFEQQWRDSVAGKTILSSEQLELAVAIQQALNSNADAHDLLSNPARKSEVSYFGIDEETGLEIRVRPDIEIRTPTENICADLKTVSIGNVRQDRIKERLHREIIDRDYHLSAAMYCDVAGLDSFSWIFVNKEPGYHWVAVVQASEAELELGRQEYRRVLRQIYEAMESDVWPAPIIGTYTDELNDYDLRRLQALVEE
ncbi:PD-(D/E)XK nuclease-like domain-containing protein [Atlantibacter subterraneus]|uniref:PD-(D/E)XK nuclease-like domain-containing protein n=1 Tax=Atlantibacter subterraneus TaxID=255519 RepID=UPI002FDCB74C